MLRRTRNPAWALLLLVGLFGCPKKTGDTPPLPDVRPTVRSDASKAYERPPVDKEALAAAPTEMMTTVDEYYVLFSPTPVRQAVELRPEVVVQGGRLLLGDARTQADAHKALVKMPMASSFFLLPATEVIAQERNLNRYDAEEEAMEVIFEIQDRFLRCKDPKALFQYFAAVTGKSLLVEKVLLAERRIFDIMHVYPIPALGRVGNMLNLEDDLWRGIDRGLDTIELSRRVTYNLKIRDEEVSWLLPALARVGRVKVRIDPQVRRRITLRVRADTCREALRQISEHAGFSCREVAGVLRIGPKR